MLQPKMCRSKMLAMLAIKQRVQGFLNDNFHSELLLKSIYIMENEAVIVNYRSILQVHSSKEI